MSHIVTEQSHKWNLRFFEMAHLVASWSKDPSTKVGAVIVDTNRRIISTGYNGFATGVNDSMVRLNDRDLKYKMVLHAEENAIMFAKRDLSGCILYVTTLPPCSHCASLIVQSGISQVYAEKKPIPDRWKDSFVLTSSIFNEGGVKLDFIDTSAIDFKSSL